MISVSSVTIVIIALSKQFLVTVFASDTVRFCVYLELDVSLAKWKNGNVILVNDIKMSSRSMSEGRVKLGESFKNKHKETYEIFHHVYA